MSEETLVEDSEETLVEDSEETLVEDKEETLVEDKEEYLQKFYSEEEEYLWKFYSKEDTIEKGEYWINGFGDLCKKNHKLKLCDIIIANGFIKVSSVTFPEILIDSNFLIIGNKSRVGYKNGDKLGNLTIKYKFVKNGQETGKTKSIVVNLFKMQHVDPEKWFDDYFFDNTDLLEIDDDYREDFNKACRIRLYKNVKKKINKLEKHVGWKTKIEKASDGGSTRIYKKSGEKLKIQKAKTKSDSICVLKYKHMDIPFSTVKEILDLIGPEISYPVFLSVIYSLIDPALTPKKPLIINLYGETKKGQRNILTPQIIANIFCNWNINTLEQHYFNSVKNNPCKITIEEQAKIIDQKINMLWDMPVIVESRNPLLKKSNTTIQRLLEKTIGNNEPDFTRFFPVILSAYPLQHEQVFNIQITGKRNFKLNLVNLFITIMYRFYDDLIDYHKDFRSIKEIQWNMEYNKIIGTDADTDREEFESFNNEFFDENMIEFAEIYAKSLAFLNMVKYKFNDFCDNTAEQSAFDDFSEESIMILHHMMSQPWIQKSGEKKEKSDVVNSFIEYVDGLLHSEHRNRHGLIIDEDNEYLYVEYKEGISKFEKKYNLNNTRITIGKGLKENGMLKTYGNQSYFVERKVNDKKIKMFAIKKDCLSSDNTTKH